MRNTLFERAPHLSVVAAYACSTTSASATVMFHCLYHQIPFTPMPVEMMFLFMIIIMTIVMATVIVIMMAVPPSRFLPCLSLLWAIPCFIQAPIGGKVPGLLQWRVAPC